MRNKVSVVKHMGVDVAPGGAAAVVAELVGVGVLRQMARWNYPLADWVKVYSQQATFRFHFLVMT